MALLLRLCSFCSSSSIKAFAIYLLLLFSNPLVIIHNSVKTKSFAIGVPSSQIILHILLSFALKYKLTLLDPDKQSGGGKIILIILFLTYFVFNYY